MKIIHLSDLHLGKRVNDYPMLDDQRYIIEQILHIIKEEAPDAVIIAGDVYDKPVPPAEAVSLFDDFICRLAAMETEVFIISGNHDSAERLSFGSRIMDKRGIHFAGGYDGSTHKFGLQDEYGTVNFYLLPFIKPVHVRQAFSDEDDADKIDTFTDAMYYAVKKMKVDTSQRNVLIAHQFCTGAVRTESEDISVGGLDNVDVSVFDPFDYTALGHLHGPQNVENERIRYCGSPLKYSFSEADQTKSVSLIYLRDKKDGVCGIDIIARELIPLKDMKVIRGSFKQLTDNDYYNSVNTEDYMRVILTDEEDVIGALGDLRAIYPNIMRLEYDNTRTRASSFVPDSEGDDSRTPLQIFADLYDLQNGKPMDKDREDLITGIIEKVWSE